MHIHFVCPKAINKNYIHPLCAAHTHILHLFASTRQGHKRYKNDCGLLFLYAVLLRKNYAIALLDEDQ